MEPSSSVIDTRKGSKRCHQSHGWTIPELTIVNGGLIGENQWLMVHFLLQCLMTPEGIPWVLSNNASSNHKWSSIITSKGMERVRSATSTLSIHIAAHGNLWDNETSWALPNELYDRGKVVLITEMAIFLGATPLPWLPVDWSSWWTVKFCCTIISHSWWAISANPLIFSCLKVVQPRFLPTCGSFPNPFYMVFSCFFPALWEHDEIIKLQRSWGLDLRTTTW